MSIKIVKSDSAIETPVSHNPAFQKRIFFKKEDVLHLMQLASATFNAGDIIEDHIHDSMSEIFCVFKGNLKLEIGKNEYGLSSGDVFVIYPGTRHKLNFICKTELLYFGLDS